MKTIAIEKLVFGGQGLGYLNGEVAFVWNALPGETVEVEVTQSKRAHIEGVAKKIITPSPYRLPPVERHFLSCSPWQIMTLNEENKWKKIIAEETYEKIGKFKLDPPLEIFSPTQSAGYRNKMEYSFYEAEDGSISFGFFERGKKYRQPIEDCVLADSAITTTANNILDWVNRHDIPLRSLKTLIVRCNTKGQTIAGLFIKDKITFLDYPVCVNPCIGFMLYYSTHKSPASVPTELLYTNGDQELTSTILGKQFTYGLFSFFQIHLPIFAQALCDMAPHIEPGAPLLDYYAGVGAIGIALASGDTPLTAVDNNAEAIAFAKKNIETNQLTRTEALCAPAENLAERITPEHTLILDPPRAGLHNKLIKKIIEVKPRRILYLSCNLSTQGRDINLLSAAYHLTHIAAYNFFPRTPHIEGFAVLEADFQ